MMWFRVLGSFGLFAAFCLWFALFALVLWALVRLCLLMDRFVGSCAAGFLFVCAFAVVTVGGRSFWL